MMDLGFSVDKHIQLQFQGNHSIRHFSRLPEISGVPGHPETCGAKFQSNH